MVLTQSISSAAILDLETHLLGELLRPAHDDYDSARQVYERGVDRHPALIVRAADAADVIRAVSFSREHGLRLAVRSGGHSVAGHGTIDDGLVLDLSRMQGLSIDPDRRVAWTQPGVTWGTYAQRAHAFGLATSSGDTASVGVGGLTLGGGIGWMVRKYGLTIDHLLSVEIVTADGRLVRASIEENPDLFWALRGGGGNFGVATAFQFRLHRAGTVMGGGVVYPATSDVVRRWAAIASSAPDELTSAISIMPAPPLPFIPAEWVGKQVAVVTLCCVGDLQRAQAMVAPLRQLGTPIADVTAPMPYPGMFQLTAEGAVPHPLAVRSGYLTGLDEGAIEAILEGSAAMPVPAGMIQLRALGGAMARVPAQASAFGHRDKPYLAMVLGIAPRLEVLEAQRAWATESWDALRAYREGSYTNFLQDEGAERVREAYSPSTYARLVDIKRRYDPYNVFRLNQNIAPDAD